MKFDENPVAAFEMMTRAYDAHEKANPRDPGLHASDLIFCPRKTWYKARMPKLAPGMRDMTMWLAGLGHHAVLQSIGAREVVKTYTLYCHPDRVYDPCGHRITATLDLEEDDPLVGMIPTEIKTTRKTSAANSNSMNYYIEQLAEYMLIWHRTFGRLMVLFLCGNYKEQRMAEFKVWDIEISPAELKAWYHELAQRAHVIQASTLPRPDRYDWECGYCPWASTKGGPCTQDELAAGRGGDKTGIKKTGFFSLDALPDWAGGESQDEEDDPDD